jgi:hypothetical protein
MPDSDSEYTEFPSRDDEDDGAPATQIVGENNVDC